MIFGAGDAFNLTAATLARQDFTGAAAAIDIEPAAGAPGKRGHEAIRRAFFEENMVLRVGGDTIALGPALVAEQAHVERLVDGVRRVLSRLS
jgi:beta-alanine--pyruvate transaminase